MCYTDKKHKTKTFPKINKWPPHGDAKKNRCDWLRNCGERKGKFASWTGMDICS